MSDNVLQSFTERLARGHGHHHDDADGAESLGAFGWLRGMKERSLYLELRKKDGGVLAMGYSWLDRVYFDPSEGITLRYGGQTIKIIGRNLNAEIRPNVRLLDGLLRHKVPWIAEADQATLMQAGKNAVLIEGIEVGN
jgi:hypothetical protein